VAKPGKYTVVAYTEVRGQTIGAKIDVDLQPLGGTAQAQR
jgi:hypothetical protein